MLAIDGPWNALPAFAPATGAPDPASMTRIYGGGFSGFAFHYFGPGAASAVLALFSAGGAFYLPNGNAYECPPDSLGAPAELQGDIFAALAGGASGGRWRVTIYRAGERIRAAGAGSLPVGTAAGASGTLLTMQEVLLTTSAAVMPRTLGRASAELLNLGPNAIRVGPSAGACLRTIAAAAAWAIDFDGALYGLALTANQIAGAGTILSELS